MTDLSTDVTEQINLIAIAEQFSSGARVTGVDSLGNGIINDTFLCKTSEAEFVLQRLNTQVFREPQLVMGNMCILTQHTSQVLAGLPDNGSGRRWELPRVLFTSAGENHYQDGQNGFWRAISFIPASYCFDTISTDQQAEEVGYGLGYFHRLISDLPPEQLADTLPGFHITPVYLQAYRQVLANSNILTSSISNELKGEVEYCLEFIKARESWASVLENAKEQGLLPLRLMHGDPKINNVMFDSHTHQAVSVIDLDTVKPGLVHYDIGDCLRSGCNPLGEDAADWQQVKFDVDICRHILKGYLIPAKAFLTNHDYAYIYDAIRLLPFELGLRFFTDYLAENVYFKVKYPEHNLARALVQFQLTASIEQQETAIRQMIVSV